MTPPGPGGPPGGDDGHRADRRIVPAYALTRGRTRPSGRNLPLETMVTTTAAGLDELPRLRFESATIVSLCRRPQSVAEVAAHLGLPLGVARVLVSDLDAGGLLDVHVPRPGTDGRPRAEVLERLLHGLRARA